MRTEDGSIIYECLNGKPQAFGVLVDKYREGIYAFAYAELRDFQDAQDVTQEVFLQAYRDLRSLRRRESFAFWLYRIAHRRCVQCCRDKSRRIDRDFIEDQDPSAVAGKIYAIGGSPDFDNILSIVEEYDPATDTWTEKAHISKMPTARVYFSTSVVNGKIYAIGGQSDWWEMPQRALSTVEEYDPVEDKWTGKADMPTARMYLSTSMVNGKIYAIGGWGKMSILSTVEEYDPATDTWTKKANMPKERQHLSTSVVNGRIYAIGGVILNPDPNRPGIYVSTVEEYDPVEDKWTRKADMPTVRAGLSTSAVGGKVYAIGGRGVDRTIPTVEEYDPMTDTWIKRADMPNTRSGFSTSVFGGKIYVIGGATGPGACSALVEEYDTGFAGQSVEAKGKLPTTWGEVKQ